MKVIPDMIGIVTKDMKRALDFYRTLGIDIPEAQDTQDHAEVITENGYRIAWDKVDVIKAILPDWSEPKGQGITIAFKVDMPMNVDAAVNKLKAAGHLVVKEPWDAFWGQRYAIVKDPDGNNIDIFAPLS